jgi:hypothetical protein
LDKVRVGPDYFALSPKKHARLPKCPQIESDNKVSLEKSEIKNALIEMELWARRKNYHSYFCAGEMAAAFSELLDVIWNRLPVSEPGKVIDIMALCVDWYFRGFEQIVDGSDGVWIFPVARIGKIVTRLIEEYPSHPAWAKFNEIVEKVALWWGEPGLNAEIIADWKDSILWKDMY